MNCLASVFVINVSKILNNALIIRTNFFGWGTSYRQSFSDFVIDNLRKGNNITLFNDVFYTPILIETLVELGFPSSSSIEVESLCSIIGVTVLLNV